MANQLNRAVVSIAANIAEGNGRFTTADRKNFVGAARGAVQEGTLWLEIPARQDLVPTEDRDRLKADIEEIARMLSGLIAGLARRRA